MIHRFHQTLKSMIWMSYTYWASGWGNKLEVRCIRVRSSSLSFISNSTWWGSSTWLRTRRCHAKMLSTVKFLSGVSRTVVGGYSTSVGSFNSIDFTPETRIVSTKFLKPVTELDGTWSASFELWTRCKCTIMIKRADFRTDILHSSL